MNQDENIYNNFTPNRGSGNRRGFQLVISISFLFLSLMANVILARLYCKLKWDQDSSMIGNCSTGGDQHLTYKDRVYIFSSDAMNWDSSRKSCQKLGGDLAIITSQDEQDLIGGLMAKLDSLYWIGLTDAVNEGVWLWRDGTPLNTNLTWWTPGDNKKDEEEDCVAYFGGKWADVPCSSSQKRICEIY